jgi:hypothetical protein
MASRRSPAEGGAWILDLGQSIGAQLGKVIAENLQRTLETSIDVDGIAQRIGAGRGVATASRRGRRPRSGSSSCAAPGCGNPVLAKGLCRSHYYKARYRAQKSGELHPARRGRKKAKAE